jgi:hypothetical protein
MSDYGCESAAGKIRSMVSAPSMRTGRICLARCLLRGGAPARPLPRRGQPRTRPLAVPAVTHPGDPRLQELAGRSCRQVSETTGKRAVGEGSGVSLANLHAGPRDAESVNPAGR